MTSQRAPQPASNKHAKPFTSITAATADALIVADTPARRSGFTRVRRGKLAVQAELAVRAAAQAFYEVG